MENILLVSVFLHFFPISFLFYKKIKNRFLFLSAVYGASFLVMILVTIAVFPFVLINIYIVPTLYQNGYLENITTLIGGINIYAEHSLYFMDALLIILLTFLIYRKYVLFHPVEEGGSFS